jgi:outer membrane protein TolC
VLTKDEFPSRRLQRRTLITFWAERLESQILLVLLAVSSLIGQTYGREVGKAMNPPEGSSSLSLSQIIASVLAHNPMIQSAEAKWFAAKQRIPQAAAWEDLRVGTNIVFGRFVSVPANAFTDQMVSIEQMIPLSGKNRSKERVAAAEALGAFEEARRQELDVIAKAKASYYQISNFYQLLDINRADEASLVHSVDNTRTKFEVGTQGQADLLLADNERQKIVEARRDIEQKLSDQESALNVLMNRDPFAASGHPVVNGESRIEHEHAGNGDAFRGETNQRWDGRLPGEPHAGYGRRLERRRFLPGTPRTREAKSPGKRQAVGCAQGEAA